jgi:hypothetical protein
MAWSSVLRFISRAFRILSKMLNIGKTGIGCNAKYWRLVQSETSVLHANFRKMNLIRVVSIAMILLVTPAGWRSGWVSASPEKRFLVALALRRESRFVSCTNTTGIRNMTGFANESIPSSRKIRWEEMLPHEFIAEPESDRGHLERLRPADPDVLDGYLC